MAQTVAEKALTRAATYHRRDLGTTRALNLNQQPAPTTAQPTVTSRQLKTMRRRLKEAEELRQTQLQASAGGGGNHPPANNGGGGGNGGGGDGHGGNAAAPAAAPKTSFGVYDVAMLFCLFFGGVTAAGTLWSAMGERTPEVIALRKVQAEEETKQLAIKSQTPSKTLSQVIGGWFGGGGGATPVQTPPPSATQAQGTVTLREEPPIRITASDCGTVQQQHVPAGRTVSVTGMGCAVLALSGPATTIEGATYVLGKPNTKENNQFLCGALDGSAETAEQCVDWINRHNGPLRVAVGQDGGPQGHLKISTTN
jgi:hypothetical protein